MDFTKPVIYVGAVAIGVQAALATYDAEAAVHHDRVPHAPASVAAPAFATSTSGDTSSIFTLLADHLEYTRDAATDRIIKGDPPAGTLVYVGRTLMQAHVIGSADGTTLKDHRLRNIYLAPLRPTRPTR